MHNCIWVLSNLIYDFCQPFAKVWSLQIPKLSRLTAATSQHFDMSRCWALTLRCGNVKIKFLILIHQWTWLVTQTMSDELVTSLCCKFLVVCVRTKIMKIGLHVSMLWAKTKRTFLRQCVYRQLRNTTTVLGERWFECCSSEKIYTYKIILPKTGTENHPWRSSNWNALRESIFYQTLNLYSVHQKRAIAGKTFFARVCQESSCLNHLLPDKRDADVIPKIASPYLLSHTL